MPISATIYLDEHEFNDRLDRTANAYINLYDSNTGAPVNGNNIEVTYQIDEWSEGVSRSFVSKVTISGQSQQIATNYPTFQSIKDEFGSITVTFYRTYIILNVSDVPNPQPPVAACDLQ